MERNDFSNFGRRSLREHFCEIILKSVENGLGDIILKFFAISSCVSHLVQWSGTI